MAMSLKLGPEETRTLRTLSIALNDARNEIEQKEAIAAARALLNRKMMARRMTGRAHPWHARQLAHSSLAHIDQFAVGERPTGF